MRTFLSAAAVLLAVLAGTLTSTAGHLSAAHGVWTTGDAHGVWTPGDAHGV